MEVYSLVTLHALSGLGLGSWIEPDPLPGICKDPPLDYLVLGPSNWMAVWGVACPRETCVLPYDYTI